MAQPQGRGRWERWWPFVLLCGLGVARTYLPSAGSSLLSLTLGSASAALVMVTWFSIVRQRSITVHAALCSVLAGAMFLCGPFFSTLFGVANIESSALVMALSLVSVVVAVARPVFKPTDGAEVAGRLWPGIAAVAGFLLILPAAFTGPAADISLIATPVLTGVGAMWFRSIVAPKMLRAVFGMMGAALVFGASGVLRHAMHLPSADRGIWMAAALDGAMVLLAVLALLRIGGTRWSAQFIIVPGVILLLGVVGFRIVPDPRTLVGFAVIVLATVFLLLPPPASEMEESRVTP